MPHLALEWAKEILMKMLMILAALMFSATLVGCHASADVDPHGSTSIALPR
jgi:hypothetical protein